MNAESTVCQCCGEDEGILVAFDVTIGALCEDCAEGAEEGEKNLRRAGISGTYNATTR